MTRSYLQVPPARSAPSRSARLIRRRTYIRTGRYHTGEKRSRAEETGGKETVKRREGEGEERGIKEERREAASKGCQDRSRWDDVIRD